MHDMTYLPGVASLALNREACTGCGACLSVCPHGVFVLEDGKARDAFRDNCMECGACAMNCAFGAVRVNPGVGCARAIIHGWLTGGPPSCDCGGGDSGCC